MFSSDLDVLARTGFPQTAERIKEALRQKESEINALQAILAQLSTQEGLQNWVEINDWKKLPVGHWLVKGNNPNRPYGIARCSLNNEEHKIITVGGMFSWDFGEIEAYTFFSRYEPKS